MSLDDPQARAQMGPLAERLRTALLRASRKLRREAQMAGVSALDAQILGVISKHPGIGAAALADHEQITRPSMSGHVKRLAAAGWIARAGVDADGRRIGLTVTEEGRRALDTIRAYRNDWLVKRLTALDPSAQRALAAAVSALEQLAEG
ncbi:MAG: winged helix-turn-helix transcriptional regulator [Alphaproteobacteria bacterium]|nr:winged helix-turn-helix transcriptional regulator [Alphaproteobacteria bacterium]